MEFPFFQVPYLGNGMVIGLDAILHVVISHGLAIGGISLVVLGEYLSVRRGSDEWNRFAYSFLKLLIIITTGIGAVTGVGIWLTTSALAPRAIASLLRIFFWPWFIEWMVFTGEVILALMYYLTWSRWTGARKTMHLRIGAAYIFFAVASALLITGILGFMLTPDGWSIDRSLPSAFFNPTYVPQLILRLGIAFSLGGLFASAFLLFTRRQARFRKEALLVFGVVTLIACIVAVLSSMWYYSVVPSPYKAHATFALLTSQLSGAPGILWAGIFGTIFLIASFLLASILGASRLARLLIVPALIFSIGSVAGFERVREFIRGPYLMPGYMYANQVLLSEEGFLKAGGILDHSYWYRAVGTGGPAERGLYLFAANCGACHTIGGINDIKTRVTGRPQDALAVLIGRTHEMVPFMTPFSGTAEEKELLAWFLYNLSARKIGVAVPFARLPAPIMEH
jgi:hypothetical protein